MALRSTPSNLAPFSGGTVTNNTNFPNGINVYSELIATNNDSVKYYKLARVRFISTSGNPNGTFERALFNIKIYHTGNNLKIGNIKGYFYNAPNKRNLHSTSFLMVINNSGSTGFSAGDLVYFPLDSGSDANDYIVDIYLKVTNWAKVYQNTESATFENGCTLTIKPDGSTLIDALPVAGTTTTIDSIIYTYGTSVNGVITSDLNSQVATIDNSIPKFSGTAGQLVGSQKLSINASDQLVSTVTTSTAPFIVSSATRVDNLNVAQLNGIADTGFLKTATASALNNNISIQAKETGGTNRDVAKLDGSNILQIGNSNNETIIQGSSVSTVNRFTVPILRYGSINHIVKYLGSITWTQGVSDEKVDIELLNAGIYGCVIIRVWANFASSNANGLIEKRIDLNALSNNGSLTQKSNYTYISDRTKDYLTMSDVIWDSTKNKYVIKICKLTTPSNATSLEIETFSNTSTMTAADAVLSSVYNTDTTVYPKANTIQTQGFNIPYVTPGTALPSSTPSFVGQEFIDTTNKKTYISTGTTNSADWLPLVSNLDSIMQTARVATTANITLSGLQTIDGYTTISGDRVLVKDQSTGSQNGLYVAASGSWSRTTDIIISHSIFNVERGTLNRDTIFMVTTDAPITIGTTALTILAFGKPISVISIPGTAAPTITPAFVGQQFVDTTNKKIYVATGTTNSSDWTIVN
jgi:hypothetical protein